MTNSNPKVISYTNLIKYLMSGYGDCSDPLRESAEMIQGILRQQMNSLLVQLADSANLRKDNKIDYEDVLFLMQSNKAKLRGLLKYIILKEESPEHFKHENSDVSSQDEVSEVDSEIEEPLRKKQKTSKSQTNHQNVKDSSGRVIKSGLKKISKKDNASSSNSLKIENCQSKVEKCMEFLKFLSGTGRLGKILEDVKDEIRREKEAKLEEQFPSSSNCRYSAYQEARQSIFIVDNFHKSEFKDWLYQDKVTDFRLTDFAFEMVGYLAQQTIATIVEFCLLVKRDKKISLLERFEMPTIPCNTTFSSYRLLSDVFLKCKSQTDEYYQCCMQHFCSMLFKQESQVRGKNAHAITPDDIMEVLFRFYQNRNVFGEKPMYQKKRQLFCCY